MTSLFSKKSMGPINTEMIKTFNTGTGHDDGEHRLRDKRIEARERHDTHRWEVNKSKLGTMVNGLLLQKKLVTEGQRGDFGVRPMGNTGRVNVGNVVRAKFRNKHQCAVGDYFVAARD